MDELRMLPTSVPVKPMPKSQVLLDRYGVSVFGLLATMICCAAALTLGAHGRPSLLHTANKLGPTAKSLVQGHGLAICYGRDGGEPCFRAQRMPLAPLTLAGLYEVVGDDSSVAGVLKTVAFLFPVVLMFAVIWKRARYFSGRGRWLVLCLFLGCLALPPTLDLAVNLNFEEAYFYGWFALAVTLLVFAESCRECALRWTAMFCVSLVICYFTKSSLLAVVVFLAAMGAIAAVKTLRRRALAAVIVCVAVAAPLLWGARQLEVSGRFSVGTSLDGVNLFKGNNKDVLARYPAFVGGSLDGLETSLLAGHVSQDDEWQQDDYARRVAWSYIRQHHAETWNADLRKISVFFFTVRRIQTEAKYSPLVEFAFMAGMIVFRLLLWPAILLALWDVLRGRQRFAAVVFLGVVFMLAAPYVAGFALTRHALVLLLPSAVYLCRRTMFDREIAAVE